MEERNELVNLLWGNGPDSGLMDDLRNGVYSQKDEQKLNKCRRIFDAFSKSVSDDTKNMYATAEMILEALDDASDHPQMSEEDKARLAGTMKILTFHSPLIKGGKAIGIDD